VPDLSLHISRAFLGGGGLIFFGLGLRGSYCSTGEIPLLECANQLFNRLAGYLIGEVCLSQGNPR
jgi:hypothetical protein